MITPTFSIEDPAAGDAARTVLARGDLAALPTETVYGLCGLAARDTAVRGVFQAKGRPAHNPLIVHGADLAMLKDIGVFGEVAATLAAVFWPGPLTLVVPLAPGAKLSPAANAGGTTVALRVPDAAFLRAVSATVGPLVTPSANRSGCVSPTTAQAVAAELDGKIALIVDGGPSPIGLESTVVDVVASPALLRPGAISRTAIEAIVGPLKAPDPAMGQKGRTLRSPGLLGSHYAPRAMVRLDVAATDVAPHEGWLALGTELSAAPASHTVRLSPQGNLEEAARGLYAGLRALDTLGVAVIAVSPIPGTGIGAAIRDRLQRAAAPRPDRRP